MTNKEAIDILKKQWTDVTANIRQALCEAQLYFTKKALEDLAEELKK